MKIKVALKLVFAASLIAGIAFAFLVANPEEKEVIASANADIYSFSGLDEANNFNRAVKSMGIRPRPYDFNGNIVYFGNSVVENSASAEETANLIQDELVMHGVNKRNYLKTEPALQNMSKSSEKPKLTISERAQARRKGMIAGELVPTRKGKHVYEMSGITGVGSVELLNKKLVKGVAGKSFSDFTNGYRYIEVRQEEGSTSAEILAVWTDENFDGDKMTNKKGVKQSAPDPEVPACIGCKRSRRVQALDESEPYNLNKWVTNANLDETYNFYVQSMQNRGWTESKKQIAVNKLAAALPEVNVMRGRGLSLEKEGKVLEITILPTENGGAEVFSMEKYKDGQTTLKGLPKPPKNVIQRLLE